MKLALSTFINRETFVLRHAPSGKAIALWITGLLFASSALAADGGVTVDNAWLRATKPGQSSAVLQFSVTSARAAKLTAIATPAAASAEIHGMSHANGAMEMRKIDALALAAGKRVDFKGSGTHVMLNALKQPLKAGDSVPFTLTVQYADGSKETVEASAEVRSGGGGGGMHDMHGM